MAATIVYTMPLRRISRHLVKRAGTVNLGAYATSGVAFAPVVGKSLLRMSIADSAADEYVYDTVNQKILAYVRTTGVEVADTTDLSAVTVNWESLGKK
jgi:hypothetical protein